MKNLKSHKTINAILAIALGLLIVACAPIEDNREIVNTFNPNDIEVSIVQNPAGSNNLTLRMLTPGVTGYWAQPFGLGVAGFGDNVENFKFPLTGTHTFTFHVSTPFIPANGNLMDREFITLPVEVDIQTLVEGTPPYLGYLVGDGSKTWVFDVIDPTDGSERWWYMTDANPEDFWWQPTGGDIPPYMLHSHMTFTLGGAFSSFSPVWSLGGVEELTGTWDIPNINTNPQVLILPGAASIPGRAQGGANADNTPDVWRNQFQILSLTEDYLILFQGYSFSGFGMAWSPGWVWRFRPK